MKVEVSTEAPQFAQARGWTVLYCPATDGMPSPYAHTARFEAYQMPITHWVRIEDSIGTVWWFAVTGISEPFGGCNFIACFTVNGNQLYGWTNEVDVVLAPILENINLPV